MKTYIPLWRKLPKTIIQEYKNGDTVAFIARKHKSAPYTVRRALLNYKVKMRPPGSGKGNRTNVKLSKDNVQTILAMDDDNIQHATIAREFNVSRERIRQICFAAGHLTRTEKLSQTPPQYQIKHEQQIARKLKFQNKLKQISKAWKDGMSLTQLGILISGKQHTSQYAMQRICYYRSKYGERMFPHRRKNSWKLLTIEQQAQRIKDIAAEWNAHGDIRRIKELFNYANTNSASVSVYRFMGKYPNLFQKREGLLQQKIEGTQLRVVK